MNIKFSKLCFLLIVIFFVSCNEASREKNAKILFEKTNYNFGEISSEQKSVFVTFRFKNSGNMPLFIKKIETSCGCTIPKYHDKVILPNENSKLEVIVTPTGRGAFYSSVTIYHNGINSPQKLSIQGEVEYMSLLE